jgi:hypothetical protein
MFMHDTWSTDLRLRWQSGFLHWRLAGCVCAAFLALARVGLVPFVIYRLILGERR